MDRHLGGLRAGGLIAELEGERIRQGERNLDKLTDEARINLMFLQTEPIKPGLQSLNGAVALAVLAGWSELNCVVFPQPETWFCLLA